MGLQKTNHAPGQTRHSRSGPCEQELHCSSSRQDLDGGYNLCPHPGGLSLAGFHPRGLLSTSGRLVELGNLPAYGSLVVDALEMALWRRKPGVGLIRHTDRGAQYTALSLGKRLEKAGIIPSMGGAGSALDNAISESFVASLKTELLHRHRFLSREAAMSSVFDYIEGFYNRVRRHSSLGYLSPSDYEQMPTMKEVAVA